MKEFAQKHYIICPLIIALLISLIYIFGLPLALINYEVAGNNIFYIFNMALAAILCIAFVKSLYPDWSFGFKLKGCADGLFKYGWIGLLGVVSILISSYYVFYPLVKVPATGTIAVWVVMNCFFVAFIEELFLRGVLLKTLLKGFKSDKHGVIIAILASSLLFGLGHIPGMLQYSLALIIMKLAWTTAFGIFLSSIYVCTDNLWTVIIFHWLFNMAAEIFYYYSGSNNVFANAWGSLIICSALAVIGLVTIVKKNDLKEHKNFELR